MSRSNRRHPPEVINRSDYIYSIPNIKVTSLIGEGGFGKVWKADIQDNAGNRIYTAAIKKVDFTTQAIENSHKRIRYLYRELTLLKIMRNYSTSDEPNYKKHRDKWKSVTMTLFNAYIINNIMAEQCIAYQIMEIFNTDLREYSKDIVAEFDANEIKYIMYQILLGLFFIHHLGIVHRDISPDNIFINNDHIKEIDHFMGRKRPRVVISDFGQSRFFIEYKGSDVPEAHAREQNFNRRTSLTKANQLGKIHYRPPEGLGYYTSDHYDKSWDIWQVGVVLLNILCKHRHVFTEDDNDYRMLTRCKADQERGLSNETYMISLIEKSVGYPSEKELKDLVFFYPKVIDHQDRIDQRTLTSDQLQYHNYKRQKCSELLHAFQVTHKRTFFKITRQMSTACLDEFRKEQLIEKRIFVDHPIVDQAINFLIQFIRYSPQSRPTCRQLLGDSFFDKSQDYFIPIADLPDDKEMYQEQLTVPINLHARYMSFDIFNFLKVFINQYITPWGYIRLIHYTPLFRKIIVIEIFKIIHQLALDSDPCIMKPNIRTDVLRQALDARLQRMMLKSLVFTKNCSSSLDILIDILCFEVANCLIIICPMEIYTNEINISNTMIC